MLLGNYGLPPKQKFTHKGNDYEKENPFSFFRIFRRYRLQRIIRHNVFTHNVPP